ncbi:hypothetical protein DI09_97p30 [Mitosporidium daphniae]|uniref:Uncharacterized protein n=1 Tax=Mitosporidium daphniae TaxID=1485682 RepID=A0A098VM17_9MICR|nr:uncharacterized protein DI09_97p30 [Mitosporidium daphniae]KGG49980.1 hypothetical protein DI09_97p30 [Mitosporidium daphniae]|eukprot:XP_013236416.1 uncharacterized protein DI09_97p30 [Mitosporidium daphniae]
MKGPSLVPWVNGSELLAVFSLLFDKSGSVSERFASASSILTSWSHRGEVPLAIESTLNIVNVILLDLNMFYGNSISNMSSGNVPLGLEELFDFPEPSEQPLFTNAPCAMSLSYAATIIR